MQRDCTRCRRPFTLDELSREETDNLEAERKANGLEGVKFLYFHGPTCGMDDIFVAILPRETEFAQDYEARRDAMETVVRGLHAQFFSEAAQRHPFEAVPVEEVERRTDNLIPL